MSRKENEVWLGNIHICNLNQILIDDKNLNEETLGQIKQMHIMKHLLFKQAEDLPETNTIALRALATTYQNIEFELQRLWGFESNINYHRFWEFPHCKCPQLDNMDSIGSGMAVYNCSCPIHGTKDQDK